MDQRREVIIILSNWPHISRKDRHRSPHVCVHLSVYGISNSLVAMRSYDADTTVVSLGSQQSFKKYANVI
jgi:hypothetical protein